MRVDPLRQFLQGQLARWFRASQRGQMPQMQPRQGVMPHHRVHRRGEDNRPGCVPGPVDAAQAVVAQTASHFRQGVGVERRDQQHIGPAAQLDVANLVAALVTPALLAAGPFVLVEVNDVAIAYRRVGVFPPDVGPTRSSASGWG